MAEPVKCDVLVIGQGLTGFAAAIGAHQRNRKVMVLSNGPGATSVSSGAWDFGPIPESGQHSLESLCQSSAWKDSFHHLLLDKEGLLDAEVIVSALREVASALAPELEMQFSFAKPLLLPTTGGTLKRVFVAQKIQALSDLSGGKKKVGLLCARNWRMLPEGLCQSWKVAAAAKGLNTDFVPVYIDWPSNAQDCAIPHLAARLQASADTVKALAGAVNKAVGTTAYELLLIPPLFTDKKSFDLLQASVRTPIGECLASTEPVAGYRLSRAIEQGLAKKKIALVNSNQIEVVGSGKKIDSIRYWNAQGSGEISAKEFILASGKFFGGGIAIEYVHSRETIFDLPIYYNRQNGEIKRRNQLLWSDRAYYEEQSWAKLGLWLNSEFRPLDSIHAPVFENLRACGSVIGGVDFAKSQIGLGFMAYTGRECACLGS